jgi:hypothetical protein
MSATSKSDRLIEAAGYCGGFFAPGFDKFNRSSGLVTERSVLTATCV